MNGPSHQSEPARRIDWVAYAMLGVTILLWSGNAIVGRALREDISPVALALLRWIGASLVVLPFALRNLKADWPRLREGWKAVAVLCVTGIAGFNTLLYAGLQSTTATNAMLLQALIPGLVLAIGAVVLGLRESGQRLAGIALSVLGAFFTIFKGDWHAVLALRLDTGDFFVLTSTLCWAIYTVTLRFAPKVDPASFLFVTFAGGAILLVPVLLLSDGGGAVHWTSAAIGGVAYVAVLPSVVAYVLYNGAVARIGSAASGQVITLMPISGALLAALLLGEALHWYHGVGIALILLGILLAAWSRPASG